MPADLATKYRKLEPRTRHVIQLLAVSDLEMNCQQIASMSKHSGWTDSDSKSLTKAAIGKLVNSLMSNEILLKGSYNRVRVNPDVQDLAIQDSVRGDWFNALTQFVEITTGRSCYSPNNTTRDLRFAFYGNEVQSFKSLTRGKSVDPNVRLLDPFSVDIFDRLDPVLQEMYLVDAVPRVITNPDTKEVLTAFDEVAARSDAPDKEFIASWLDLALARGDLDSIRRLDELTRNKSREVAGCAALLTGDFERAEVCLGAAMPGGKRKSSLAVGRLPGVFYLLLLMKKGTSESLAEAHSIVAAATKARKGRFAALIEIASAAISFQQTPSSPAEFASQLAVRCNSPLETLFAGYFSAWLLADEDRPIKVSRLVGAAKQFRSAGLDWFAAETLGLAGKLKSKGAADRKKRHGETHKRLGTTSLINLVEPQPAWSRSLSAIALLAGGDLGPATPAATQAIERLIWEFDPSYGSISLDAFLQKRSGSGWSKGRKVAARRLYEDFNDPEFAFLTDQDRELCRSIECEVSRNHYGYTEEYYDYDNLRAARALIGHPCVFLPGERDNPLEIVEQKPRLVVAQESDGRISLALDPEPYPEAGDLRLIQDGQQRVAIVFFSERHLKLHSILGKKLTVPASAADEVIRSIEPVVSLVSVHSEIGGQSAAETVVGDARTHIHLLPYEDGLRAEFFVRPFGNAGPFCRPGQGGTNLFADIDGHPQTASRDLDDERRRQERVIASCPELAARAAGSESFCFPSPVEALEALVQLEDLGDEQVELHWPQGRCLRLAGRASASQFQVRVRKDRDWFAVSGKLNVDKSLSIDMLQLVDLIEATPGRFVKLDDGRFLALTAELRQRIKELEAFGDRRPKQNKLRFPRVRAAALEELTESVKLSADTHWKEWVQRMRDAADVSPEVPTTLQTELRDYQLEGFQWLARLAAWGVGGCLADDMGLGKTIQALALLLQRAGGGPALVVAPTSVVFNWLDEARRFAPTLNVRVFGQGDRAAFLKNLGPHDVVVCSYGLLQKEAKRLQALAWNTVVLDEAQGIKNTATQRSQAAKGLQADFRLILTGTPLENHLGELWNLLEFINPGLLGSWDSFHQRFAVPIERDGCREARQRLKRLIRPFILRRTKSQVLQELPPRTELTLQVELSDEEAAFYEALRQRAIESLAKAADGPQHLQVLAEIMRLRRACCHPRLVLDDCAIAGSKLRVFAETMDELLANHHKVLVFSQFVDHLAILRDELESKGVTYQYLDGSTPARQRKQRVEAFQAGEGDVFLISLKAGGLGLNLTAADYVIHMDPWWNPAVEDQASDRAHRLGQQRPVTIYRFITRGTIEQRITELHATKRDLADSLLEGTEMSGKLSVEELLKLIRE